MNKEVEKIKKSGRDSIIKLAIKQLNEDIDVSDIMIQVKANKTSVIVSFHSPIVYVPLNTVFLL